jgi:hypothetical protein
MVNLLLVNTKMSESLGVPIEEEEEFLILMDDEPEVEAEFIIITEFIDSTSIMRILDEISANKLSESFKFYAVPRILEPDYRPDVEMMDYWPDSYLPPEIVEQFLVDCFVVQRIISDFKERFGNVLNEDKNLSNLSVDLRNRFSRREGPMQYGALPSSLHFSLDPRYKRRNENVSGMIDSVQKLMLLKPDDFTYGFTGKVALYHEWFHMLAGTKVLGRIPGIEQEVLEFGYEAMNEAITEHLALTVFDTESKSRKPYIVPGVVPAYRSFVRCLETLIEFIEKLPNGDLDFRKLLYEAYFDEEYESNKKWLYYDGKEFITHQSLLDYYLSKVLDVPDAFYLICLILVPDYAKSFASRGIHLSEDVANYNPGCTMDEFTQVLGNNVGATSCAEVSNFLRKVRI